MSLVQIVPNLSSQADGVAQMARALARGLEAVGLATRFVSGSDVFGDSTRLKATLESGPVLLHYVGYGYHADGCPNWLVEGIEGWRNESGGRLLVLFHEVFATGPPWSRTFWFSPSQRAIARRLAQACDRAVTSLEAYATLLRPWRAGRSTEVWPVVSPFVEPGTVEPLSTRHSTLLVLGGPGNRQRMYRSHGGPLRAACEALGIEEVLDVGPTPERQQRLPGFRAIGPLGDAAVGQLLLEARAGLVSYPAGFFAKSTVAAAYCAHGLLPVCLVPSSSSEGLVEGRHYWSPGSSSQIGDQEQVARDARAWYLGHGLEIQAKWYARALGLQTSP